MAVASKKIQRALDNAVTILKENLSEFGDAFQISTSTNNFYDKSVNNDWTTGFCTGEYWLAYENSGDTDFRDTALRQVDTFLDRIKRRFKVNHHDMGFLYTPSCVAAYKLTGNETAKTAALLAADNLIARFHEKGQFLQAWGDLGAADNYRLIIDCLMNLPLLYWASDVTGNPLYRERAIAHTSTSIANLIREDSSAYHTFFFDPATGLPLRGETTQGYKNDSAWARGQAWGIYGLALSYRYTKNPQCIELFKRVTDFFLMHLPTDKVPYWDLIFMDGDEPRDSSAGAIAACGMLEMANYLPAEDAAHYASAANSLAEALIDNCAVSNHTTSNGLLLHGVYGKKSPYNPLPADVGVDECSTWGDYFYLEMLTRLSKVWNPYW